MEGKETLSKKKKKKNATRKLYQKQSLPQKLKRKENKENLNLQRHHHKNNKLR